MKLLNLTHQTRKARNPSVGFVLPLTQSSLGWGGGTNLKELKDRDDYYRADQHWRDCGLICPRVGPHLPEV